MADKDLLAGKTGVLGALKCSTGVDIVLSYIRSSHPAGKSFYFGIVLSERFGIEAPVAEFFAAGHARSDSLSPEYDIQLCIRCSFVAVKEAYSRYAETDICDYASDKAHIFTECKHTNQRRNEYYRDFPQQERCIKQERAELVSFHHFL